MNIIRSFVAMPKNSLIPLLILGVLSAAVFCPSADAADSFKFQPNDVVAVYGNGLADRLQHEPWVETVLQSVSISRLRHIG